MNVQHESGGLPPLGFLLRQAAAAHRLRMEHALVDLGVTPPQFLVMTLMQINPGCSNADIARMSALKTPTVTVILANMASKDIFTATDHPTSKRIKSLHLSDTGRALLTECRKRAAIVEKELETPLSLSDIRTVATWLQAITTVDNQANTIKD